jgi:hypothetical protein
MLFSRFEEEIFTTGEVRDSCIPISSPPEDHSMTWYIVVGVIVTVGLLVLASGAFFHYKTRRKQGNMRCCMLSSG